MMRVLATIDIFFLNGMITLRRFCVEWLSWTVRGMERTMIVLYFLTAVATQVRDPHPYFTVTLFMLIVGFVSSIMWREQKRTDQERLLRLMFEVWMYLRMLSVVFVMILVGGCAFSRPHHWTDVLGPMPMFFYTCFQYSVSLPAGGGKRGRKRKLAIEELKSMFGGWLPVPEGA